MNFNVYDNVKVKKSETFNKVMIILFIILFVLYFLTISLTYKV